MAADSGIEEKTWPHKYSQKNRDFEKRGSWELHGKNGSLSERAAVGTVREDYSENGNAWDYFSHDQARSRAYRWGEDGLAGISDDQQLLCFALALWNGKDPNPPAGVFLDREVVRGSCPKASPVEPEEIPLRRSKSVVQSSISITRSAPAAVSTRKVPDIKFTNGTSENQDRTRFNSSSFISIKMMGICGFPACQGRAQRRG